MTWLPMPAPKDGEDYLLTDLRVGGGFAQVCFWDESLEKWCVKDCGLEFTDSFFTHWRPIPGAEE